MREIILTNFFFRSSLQWPLLWAQQVQATFSEASPPQAIMCNVFELFVKSKLKIKHAIIIFHFPTQILSLYLSLAVYFLFKIFRIFILLFQFWLIWMRFHLVLIMFLSCIFYFFPNVFQCNSWWVLRPFSEWTFILVPLLVTFRHKTELLR